MSMKDSYNRYCYVDGFRDALKKLSEAYAADQSPEQIKTLLEAKLERASDQVGQTHDVTEASDYYWAGMKAGLEHALTMKIEI